jgi:NADPH2:quinone reductase
MQAVLMTAVGGPEVLQLRDIATPELTRSGDLLVRLKAAGVNPIDTKLRSRGSYYPERLPTLLGCDGAGIVEQVGAQVSRFQPGDAVWFCNGGIGGHPGNYAEYALVDEQFAAHKPARLDFAEAAAAPLVLITAWESLFERAALSAGQRVLIHAGAGGVGHVAVQLAADVGAHVAATVGSDDKAALVTRLGAEQTILYKESDFVAETVEWSDGRGADLVFDTIGGATFQHSFAATRPYGDLVTLLQPQPDTDWSEARLRNLRISMELMLTPMIQGMEAAHARQASILQRCATLVDEHRLDILVSHRLPLAEAARAHALLEAGGAIGKIVLTMD